jgi:hypothetical protein
MTFLKNLWTKFTGLKRWQKVVVVILLLSLIGAISGGGDTPSTPDDKPAETKVEEPTKSASFSGEIGTWDAINPASGVVTFTITNNGDAPGKPDCKVAVQDSSGTYRGYDYPIFDQDVAPGESVKGNMTLTVTKEGAAYVSTGSVTCS